MILAILSMEFQPVITGLPLMMLKKIPVLFVLCGSVSALAACQVPHAFPSGYIHHGKEFKSATPPPSSKFTMVQRATMGVEQAEQFRLAVYSLVENLTTRAGLPPKPVYVLRADPMTPFYANIDNDVRESLRHMGYRLSDTPQGAYIITYNAMAIKPPAVSEGMTPAPIVVSAQENTSVPNVTIGLFVHDGVGEQSRLLTKEEGDFYIRGADVMSIPFAQFKDVTNPALTSAEDRTVRVQTTE